MKHFKKLISISATETLERILKFATGFSSTPPWGLRNKIPIKFLTHDDDKLFDISTDRSFERAVVHSTLRKSTRN